jgi:phosphatidylglycerol:prolipoprotein diacylglycerol transferase
MRVALIVAVYLLTFWGVLPALLLSCAARLDALVPVPLRPEHLWQWSGAFVIVLGAGLMLASSRALWRHGKGLPISHLAPTELVAEWPYNWYRHPIYVGYSVAFAGVGAVLTSFWTLALALPVLICAALTYVWAFEEPRLLARYGERYASHRKAVGLLGPTRRRLAPVPSFSKVLSRLLDRLARDPVLIRLGPVIVVKYGVFCAVGAFLMVFTALVLLHHAGIDAASAHRFVIAGAVAVGLVSWVFWWIPRWRAHIRLPYFGLTQNGFVSYGGVVGCFAVAWAFSRSEALSFWFVSDVITLGFFFPYLFGRLGCVAHGCCWGSPTDGFPSVTYWHAEAKVNRLGSTPGVPRHPTQLYSSVHGALCLATLGVVALLAPPVGTVTAIGFVMFAAGRLLIDCWREDPRPILGWLSYSQSGALVLLAIGLAIIWLADPARDAGHFELWQAARSSYGEVSVPVAFACLVIMLLIFGVHWRRIGSWGG